MEPNAIVIGLLALPVYFLPTIIALREDRNFMPVFALNLFFGWTLIGWVVALVRAKPPETKEAATDAATTRHGPPDAGTCSHELPSAGTTGHEIRERPAMSRAFPFWLTLPVAAVILFAVVYVALTELKTRHDLRPYAGMDRETAELYRDFERQLDNLSSILGDGEPEQYENWTDRFFAWFGETPLGASIVVSIVIAMIIALLSIPILLWRNGRKLAELQAAQNALATQNTIEDAETKSPDRP